MREVVRTKFDHWKYEEEYRLYVNLKEEIENIYYQDFSKDLLLKQIIIGSGSDITREEISIALGKFSESVKVLKARPAFKSFRVVENKNAGLWT
jgi:hypothetical protein